MIQFPFSHVSWLNLHVRIGKPFWKPSVAPYVVSFWVRQSLRHAYVRRVFPYVKQIEENPKTRSPYAAKAASEAFAYAKHEKWQGPENVKGGF